LEGGGMRGLYTAGILDFFLEKEVHLPYAVGVSAGACHASSYFSRQQGRNKVVNIDYVDDSRYLSIKNLLTGQGLFGMDFIFNTIPYQLEPFNFTSFYNYEGRFLVGTTDCKTGEAVYFDRQDCSHPDEMLTVMKASSSLPFIASPVEFAGRTLMDGGLAAPIPIQKSEADGNQYNVVILTRPSDYRKQPFKFNWVTKLVYNQYPGLVQALETRYQRYNQVKEYIAKLEAENKVFVFQPPQPLEVGRIETDQQKLTELYQQGYQQAQQQYAALKNWLEKVS